MFYTKYCLPCQANGVDMQVCLIDDCNIVPLLIDNANYWWNNVKAYYPSHVQTLLDDEHMQSLKCISRVLEFGTEAERLAYCNLIDAIAHKVIARVQALC